MVARLNRADEGIDSPGTMLLAFRLRTVEKDLSDQLLSCLTAPRAAMRANRSNNGSGISKVAAMSAPYDT